MSKQIKDEMKLNNYKAKCTEMQIVIDELYAENNMLQISLSTYYSNKQIIRVCSCLPKSIIQLTQRYLIFNFKTNVKHFNLLKTVAEQKPRPEAILEVSCETSRLEDKAGTRDITSNCSPDVERSLSDELRVAIIAIDQSTEFQVSFLFMLE
jgi:hypothetical protein